MPYKPSTEVSMSKTYKHFDVGIPRTRASHALSAFMSRVKILPLCHFVSISLEKFSAKDRKPENPCTWHSVEGTFEVKTDFTRSGFGLFPCLSTITLRYFFEFFKISRFNSLHFRPALFIHTVVLFEREALLWH